MPLSLIKSEQEREEENESLEETRREGRKEEGKAHGHAWQMGIGKAKKGMWHGYRHGMFICMQGKACKL